MIVDFTLENFKSIADRQTISFMPMKGSKTSKYFTTEKGQKSVKRLFSTSILFGQNASGKSNILKGFEVLASIINNSFKYSTEEKLPHTPFKYGDDWKDVPTFFELRFFAKYKGYERLFTYSISFIEKAIVDEQLSYVNKQETEETLIFIRKYDKIEIVSKLITDDNDIYKNIFPTRSVLSYLLFMTKDGIETLVNVKNQMRCMVILMTNKITEVFTNTYLDTNMYSKETLLKFMSNADFSIQNIEQKKDEANGFSDKLKTKMLSNSSEEVKSLINKISFNDIVKFTKQDDDGHIATFDLKKEESLGTNTFYNLAGPILAALKVGGCLVMDELEQALHPRLLNYVLEVFNNPSINTRGAQLLFTSHYVTILDEDTLHPDQIYLTLQSRDQKTRLKSMGEYKSTLSKSDRRSSLSRKYMQGYFMAVPLTFVDEDLLEE